MIDDWDGYVGDLIDDAWQVHYFGTNNPLAGPLMDPDGDGQTNRFEYIAGTDPTNALSRLVFWIEPETNPPTHRHLFFDPRFADRSHTVQFRTNVASGSFAPLTGAATNDLGTLRMVTDQQATNAARFYRVYLTYP